MCPDSKTVRQTAACVAGKSCHRCGRAAVRLAHGWFYCDRHFPHGKGAAGQPPRCLLRGEGRRSRPPARSGA